MSRVIIRPDKVSLSDFIGDFNYLPSLIRQAKHEPMPTMYDAKQLTALYGILPFGAFVKTSLSSCPRSSLLQDRKRSMRWRLKSRVCSSAGHEDAANTCSCTPYVMNSVPIYSTYRRGISSRPTVKKKGLKCSCISARRYVPCVAES